MDWATILGAIGRSQTGDREGGRDSLDACWAQTETGDHAYRCLLAHYLADVQDALDDEVAWDETALREHAQVAPGDLAEVGIPDAAGLAPSLHLNLGDGYRRQGRVEAAVQQLGRGRATAGALSDDGYGRMIREGLARLELRLATARSGTGR